MAVFLPTLHAQFFLEEDTSGRSHGLWASGSWSSVTFHVGSVLGAGGWGSPPSGHKSIGRRRILCLGEQSTPASPGTVSTWWVMAQHTGHLVPGVPGSSQHKVITPTGQHMPDTQCLLNSSPQLSAWGREPGRGEGAGVASVHRALGQVGWWMPRGVKGKQRRTWEGAGWGSGDDEQGQVAARVEVW